MIREFWMIREFNYILPNFGGEFSVFFGNATNHVVEYVW